ncbi:MAG TPA: hypothetical protein VNS58_28840 [Puia sp.]|nr:hypothetical protein [Puia sp.]
MRIGYQRIKAVFFLSFLFLFFHTNGQSDTKKIKQSVILPLPDCFVEPGYRFVDTNQVIGDRSYRHTISQIYNTLAGGQSGGLASAGTFDPVAGTFSLNYAQEIKIARKHTITMTDSDVYCNSNLEDFKGHAKHSWFLSLSAGGSIIGNNIGVLFNNSKFNSGATITGKILIPLHNSIIIGGYDADGVFKKKQAIEYQRWSDKKKIWSTVKSSYADLNLDETMAKRDQEKLSAAALRNKAKKVKEELDKDIIYGIAAVGDSAAFAACVNERLTLADSLLTIDSQADSLDKDQFTLQLKQDSLNYIKKVILADEQRAPHRPNTNLSNYGIKQYQKIDSFYDRLRDSAEMNANFSPYTLRWLGIVGSFNRNSYYTYFDSLAFSNRISSSTLSLFNIGLEFNLIHYNPLAMHYFNFGLLRIRNNNIGDLTTSPLSVKVRTSLNDTTQKITQTYNVYTSPIKEYEAWNPYINYYLFLGKSQQQGLHLSSQAEFRNSGQNPVNLGLGYIFSFKNSKDNSVLNVEAYVKFQDLFKALPEQESHFYSRNTIGLLFGIPINFPTTQ